MAYNPYGNYGYGMYPQYNANMGYQNFQQPTMQSPMAQQQMVQPQNQSAELPFSEMLFGTLKEAEGYIVAPNKSVCFVNNALGEIYVKSADGMGNPSFKTYKLANSTNSSTETKTTEFNPKEYLKKEDLVGIVMKTDLEGMATKQDLANFITKKDFETVSAQLDNLSKKIKISEFLDGDKNGK